MTEASPTPVDVSAARATRLVELVDRFFVLPAVGFFLLLPASGWAAVMFDSWYDQKRDLAALRGVLADGRAPEIANDLIGPAYIAAGAAVHHITGLDAADALILLTRLSFVLAIGCGVLLVRALVRGLVSAPPLVSLGAQILFVGLLFAAGTWHWSDVPWSHFFAAFLAVSLYTARFVPTRATVLSAAIVGACLSLLWLTRTFELVAVVVAWAAVLALYALPRLREPTGSVVTRVVVGGAAFLVTTAAVHGVTGKRDLFLLYQERLGSQSGSVAAGEVAETPTFSVALIPTKLVQLFVDPCFDSLCSVSDYSGRASLSPLLTEEAGNLRLWSLPLGVQLPSLLLAPLCLAAVGVLVLVAARRPGVLGSKARELRLLSEMTLASVLIVIGYTASTLSGPPHLRYGFARDFLLPALLCAIVGVTLASVGLWRVLSARRWTRPSPEFVYVVLAFATCAVLVLVLAIARAEGVPRIESRHLAAITYRASCRPEACAVSVVAESASGRRVSIRDASVLTFACGRGTPRFTIYARDLRDLVALGRRCESPRLVAAWPTVMGLPPGSFELAAVGVRNV